ncbi:MAG: 4Fe-4S binding protein [Defluviitaleaceae bacterium]|nr:4Fe-4S binding protein [Defluviitaleaceae bacterium]
MNFTIILGILVLLMVIVTGRLFCGRVCPLGFLQDIFFKIPFFFKIKTFKHDRHLRSFKYVYFCVVYIGIPALIAIGFIYQGIPSIILSVIMGAFFLMAVIVKRPYCKFNCNAGAVGALFNKISFWRYKIVEEKCNGCNLCTKVCKMDIIPYKLHNTLETLECIRCGKCVKACPKEAIVGGFGTKVK